MKTVGWEPAGNGKFYVVEHGGMLKTGPFSTKGKAVAWFRNELEMDILIQGECDERENQTAAEVEERTAQGATTEETEYLDGEGPTETFVGHCPGCAASR